MQGPLNPIVYAIPVFVATMAIEALIAYRQRRAIYQVSDAITSLNMGLLSQVVGGFTKLATLGIYTAVYELFRLQSWPMQAWWAWVIALILYDFFYYWAHRCGHEVNLLWAAHVVHHSSEYFNLSTALRQSSTGALFGWVFYLPMAVLGVPPLMFVVVGLINLLYQYWPHTELIGRLGWIDRVFVTPSNHRVHHGQNDYCLDRNYGGILIVWDRLFGTFQDERADEPVCFGIRKPLRSFDPLWGNLHTYAGLLAQAAATRSWRGKLAVVLGPPAGWPVGADAHADRGTAPPVPGPDAASFQRFAIPLTRGQQLYALLHYVGAMLLLMHFLAMFSSLAPASRVGHALVLIVGVWGMGGLLALRRVAIWIEPLRLVAFAGSFAWAWAGMAAAPDGGGLLSGDKLLIGLVFVVSLAAWWRLFASSVSGARSADSSLAQVPR